MIMGWLEEVPKFNKMTVDLIHFPRDWKWQISGGNEGIIRGRYETLRIEWGRCQNPKYRANLENIVKVIGNKDTETGSQAIKITLPNDIIPAKNAFNVSRVYITLSVPDSILKVLPSGPQQVWSSWLFWLDITT